MSKRRLTEQERLERIDRRAAARQAVADLADSLREWRDERRRAATKADRERTYERRTQPRGVDRVPEHLKGLAPTVEQVAYGKRTPAVPLAGPDDLHPAGNHALRRQRGQRGKARKPRARELPGAVARRVERNRKAWSSS